MRFVQYPCDAEDDEEYRSAVEQHERDKMVRSADWNVYADEVLQKIDEQLAAFGLEVIQYETGSDYYEWHIERRIPRSAEEAATEAVWREEKARQETAPIKLLSMKEAMEFFSNRFGWSQEDWDPGNRNKDALEPWREEHRRQFAAVKADLGRDEKGTTGPPGVLLTEKH